MSVLARIAPVYAVLGNHDLYAGKDAVRKVLRESGVILLNDKTVTLKRDGECLVLSGVRQPASRKHPYTKFRGNAAEDQYHIILVHDPIWLKGKEETHGDLLLAGHTHGGQIVLPIAGAVRLERFYKKFKSGWYTLPRKASESVHSSRLLISRGFGTSHIPLRLKCPAEFHVITLRKNLNSIVGCLTAELRFFGFSGYLILGSIHCGSTNPYPLASSLVSKVSRASAVHGSSCIRILLPG